MFIVNNNLFHTFFGVFTVGFEQVNDSWGHFIF